MIDYKTVKKKEEQIYCLIKVTVELNVEDDQIEKLIKLCASYPFFKKLQCCCLNFKLKCKPKLNNMFFFVYVCYFQFTYNFYNY